MKKLRILISIILCMMLFLSCANVTCSAYSKYKTKPKVYGMSKYQEFYSPVDYREYKK